MRTLIRPRRPVLALLLLAPSIPELLTGSTPVSRLATDPVGFAVSYLLDIGLYGTGALVIRECSVILRRGWASILLWGAAYGIAEEGLAVHTFFERSGPPVGRLTFYGSAYGVNGLWALGLTVFHATYSVALPILLTYLWFPEARGRRWMDNGLLGLTAAIYLGEVGVLAHLVGHGPSPPLLAVFLVLEVGLVLVGALAPAGWLTPRPGPRTVGRRTLGVAGALEWIAWVVVLVLASATRAPAVVAAAVLVGANALALGIVVRNVGSDDLDRSTFAFAVGMLVPLFIWDVIIEFSVPGILVVAALFAYLLYRLGRTLDGRAAAPLVPPSGASQG